MGKIRKSKSKARYLIFFVVKKNRGRQPYIDYRQLNDITKKNRYLLLKIDKLRDKLYSKKWFTKLDLKIAFHMIRIKEGDEWKTVFRSQLSLYEYLIIPFGLINTPMTL